ncbi:hypothetical protein ENBRE01_0971 [Enteropsectra breve]|nr:hypothetical protein ENBRE01_0971 [Enteropsectra breve]
MLACGSLILTIFQACAASNVQVFPDRLIIPHESTDSTENLVSEEGLERVLKRSLDSVLQTNLSLVRKEIEENNKMVAGMEQLHKTESAKREGQYSLILKRLKEIQDILSGFSYHNIHPGYSKEKHDYSTDSNGHLASGLQAFSGTNARVLEETSSTTGVNVDGGSDAVKKMSQALIYDIYNANNLLAKCIPAFACHWCSGMESKLCPRMYFARLSISLFDETSQKSPRQELHDNDLLLKFVDIVRKYFYEPALKCKDEACETCKLVKNLSMKRYFSYAQSLASARENFINLCNEECLCDLSNEIIRKYCKNVSKQGNQEKFNYYDNYHSGPQRAGLVQPSHNNYGENIESHFHSGHQRGFFSDGLNHQCCNNALSAHAHSSRTMPHLQVCQVKAACSKMGTKESRKSSKRSTKCEGGKSTEAKTEQLTAGTSKNGVKEKAEQAAKELSNDDQEESDESQSPYSMDVYD